MRWLAFGAAGGLVIAGVSLATAPAGLARAHFVAAVGVALALAGAAIQYYTPTGRPLFFGKFPDHDRRERDWERRQQTRPVTPEAMPATLMAGRATTFCAQCWAWATAGAHGSREGRTGRGASTSGVGRASSARNPLTAIFVRH